MTSVEFRTNVNIRENHKRLSKMEWSEFLKSVRLTVETRQETGK